MELINEYKMERFFDSVSDYAGIFIFVIIVLVMATVAIAYGMTRTVKADDNKASARIKGKVLEKYVENQDTNAVLLKLSLRIEWIVIEGENGNRLRLRNMPANNIQILPGDKGVFTYRGETIYRFDREAAVTNGSGQKIPAWQRVEMEKAEAERKATEEAKQ